MSGIGESREIVVIHNDLKLRRYITEGLLELGYGPENRFYIWQYTNPGDGIRHITHAPFYFSEEFTHVFDALRRGPEVKPVDLMIFGQDRNQDMRDVDPYTGSLFTSVLRSMDWHNKLKRACKETPVVIVSGKDIVRAFDGFGSDYVPGAPPGAPTRIDPDNLTDSLGIVARHYLGSPDEARMENAKGEEALLSYENDIMRRQFQKAQQAHGKRRHLE